jgi:hypothetical protein
MYVYDLHVRATNVLSLSPNIIHFLISYVSHMYIVYALDMYTMTGNKKQKEQLVAHGVLEALCRRHVKCASPMLDRVVHIA